MDEIEIAIYVIGAVVSVAVIAAVIVIAVTAVGHRREARQAAAKQLEALRAIEARLSQPIAVYEKALAPYDSRLVR